MLWPDVEDGRAAGNLRSALWRLQQVGCPLVVAEQSWLGLREDVEVDLPRLEAWAARVLADTRRPPTTSASIPVPIADLELLPGWYDDWVLSRPRAAATAPAARAGGAEPAARRAGRPAAAVEAMHVAVLAEPLRESGQRALIEAHQAAGDWIAARRQYDAFRSILRREIGVEPSAELTAVARGPARPRSRRFRPRCRCARRWTRSGPPPGAPPRPSWPARWSAAA